MWLKFGMALVVLGFLVAYYTHWRISQRRRRQARESYRLAVGRMAAVAQTTRAPSLKTHYQNHRR